MTRGSDEAGDLESRTFEGAFLYANRKFGFQLQRKSLYDVSGTVYAPVEFEVTEGAGILYLIRNTSTTTD